MSDVHRLILIWLCQAGKARLGHRAIKRFWITRRDILVHGSTRVLKSGRTSMSMKPARAKTMIVVVVLSAELV